MSESAAARLLPGIALLALLSACGTGKAVGTGKTPGVRRAEGGGRSLRVLRISGGPREMGLQQGRLLHGEIRRLHDMILRRRVLAHPAVKAQALFRQAARFAPHIPPRYREEMRGIAEGADVPYREVLLANVFYDLMELNRVPLGIFACSSVAGRNAAGRIVVGRNLDYQSFGGALPPAGLVAAVSPRTGRSFVKVGFAGQVGVWTGINAEGLFAAIHTSRTEDVQPAGTPVNLLLRRALEEAAHVGPAVSLFRRAARVSGANVLLADARPASRAVVLEFSARRFSLRRGAPSLACTNHFLTLPGRSRRPPRDSLRRYSALIGRLEEAAGRLEYGEARRLLRSPEVLRTGERDGLITLHTVLAIPERGRIDVSAGAGHPGRRPFYSFRVGRLLRAEVGLRTVRPPRGPGNPMPLVAGSTLP